MVLQTEWKHRALGLALALLREGHFEWEDFRQALLRQLAKLDSSVARGRTADFRGAVDAGWQYCQQWALALESVMMTAGLVDAGTVAELRGLAQHAERETLQQDTLQQTG